MGRWGSRSGSSSSSAAVASGASNCKDGVEHSGGLAIAGQPEQSCVLIPNPACPPIECQNASVENPPAGYKVHKGCLYPDEALRSLKDPPERIVSQKNEASPEKLHRSRWRDSHAEKIKESEEINVESASASTAFHEEKRQRNQQRNARRARRRAEQRSESIHHDSDSIAVLWLRDDLRLDDNPALRAAAHFKHAICVFIHDMSDPSPWPLRGAARWWKYRSIQEFTTDLGKINGSLFIHAGSPMDILSEICSLVGASVVLWNRLCEPWYRERDLEVERVLQLNGLDVRSFKASVLWEPWEACPDERSYDRGFGSVGFYRSAVEELGEVEEPQPPVVRMPALPQELKKLVASASVPLEALGYHRTTGYGFPSDFREHNEAVESDALKIGVTGNKRNISDWASEMRHFWKVGEQAALARLKEFLEKILMEGLYEQRERFRADRRFTAILSPHIRFGELSPRRCFHEASKYAKKLVTTEKGPRPVNNTFVRRFFWRDLAYWQLWKYPTLPQESLRPHYESERWSGTPRQLKLWQRGRTGFPLVDAGMRQLWKVGWMPNYLRHVCAQFLIEFLDISWKKGFEWFDYTLVDSDVAINAYMWQNGGHSGLDQWNFVMHPVYAAKSCDPQGDYVRRWLPELKELPLEYIHCPWEAPARLLLGANVLFARTYFERIIEDLDVARRDHAREVLRVRRENSEMIAKGGNEWFQVRPGYWVTLITRDDFRWETDEQVTRQTADDPRNAKRRQLQDPLSLVLGDFVKQHDRIKDV